MQCPRCGVVNDESAAACSCGFTLAPPPLPATPPPLPTAVAEPAPPAPDVPLARHKYPGWIWAMAVFILASIAASMIELPRYYKAATLLHTAEMLADRHQDSDAIRNFQSVLDIVPSSKRARIGIAISYFRSPDRQDRRKAMAALRGVKIQKSEWERLKAVMPPAYQRLFEDVKE